MATDISDGGFTIADGTLAVAPHPVRGRSWLSHVVPRRTSVRLALLDILRREVLVLAEGERQPGRYAVSLDAERPPPGLHFVR